MPNQPGAGQGGAAEDPTQFSRTQDLSHTQHLGYNQGAADRTMQTPIEEQSTSKSDSLAWSQEGPTATVTA